MFNLNQAYLLNFKQVAAGLVPTMLSVLVITGSRRWPMKRRVADGRPLRPSLIERLHNPRGAGLDGVLSLAHRIEGDLEGVGGLGQQDKDGAVRM